MKRFEKLLLFGLIFLSACSTTTEDLHSGPHEKGSFVVNSPYQITYENIARSARKCFPGRGIVAAYYYSRSVELETGKAGRVEAELRGGFEETVLVSLDVLATPSGTEIDYFVGPSYFGRFDSRTSFRPIAQEWANGNSSKCF